MRVVSVVVKIAYCAIALNIVVVVRGTRSNLIVLLVTGNFILIAPVTHANPVIKDAKFVHLNKIVLVVRVVIKCSMTAPVSTWEEAIVGKMLVSGIRKREVLTSLSSSLWGLSWEDV